MTQIITYAEAIQQAIQNAMDLDDGVICFGLGVTDPKGIFGTTLGLEKEFGKKRVFDMPASENAMTGIAIGASLNGIKPVMTHQRLDFFLLAMDQLVNGASKLHYMFGKQLNVPITIRLILGRGWGQGPTHSQSLQAWFSHIPGLKVVMPTTPYDAKGLLLSSIFDLNPVIFIEHRWLHSSIGEVPKGDYRIPLHSALQISSGKDITIVSMSYLTIEAKKATNFLKTKNIHCDLIDLRSIKPIDWKCIYDSVERTGRLLVLDSGFTTGSVSGEVIARVSMDLYQKLKSPPSRMACPDFPEPTSYALTKDYYISAGDIAKKITSILEVPSEEIDNFLPKPAPHDTPGDYFKGPF